MFHFHIHAYGIGLGALVDYVDQGGLWVSGAPPCPPPSRPTWVVWVNELSSEAWAVLFSISASLFPFTAEAALSSVGHGTRSRSWKGLLQPSTPVWTRGKTRASLPSHLQAYLRVLELLFIYIFIYMELLRLSTISRWPWRKSWTLSA